MTIIQVRIEQSPKLKYQDTSKICWLENNTKIKMGDVNLEGK